MSLLVTGSLAFDRIAVFPDRFATHILPRHVHRLNVGFNIKKMTINYGGTGGNIAYNLALLGESPILLAAVGSDFEEYKIWLNKNSVSTDYLKTIPRELTAHASIITDMDDNQITAFYEGAMAHAHKAKISSVYSKTLCHSCAPCHSCAGRNLSTDTTIELAIIAPNGLKAMPMYARELKKKNVPYIADPGQSIPALPKQDLTELINGSFALVANDYEWEMICEKTGLTKARVLSMTGTLIITYGAEGSRIEQSGKPAIKVPAFKAPLVVDPTGCGDAFRAGLMYGIKNQFPLEKATRLGAWLAAKSVAIAGTQNHKISRSEFRLILKSFRLPGTVILR